MIKQMKFSGYFLIVWDFIRYAKEQGIPVGPGRGSAAGSLVGYAMEITDIDPLQYGLLFERFLNPERVSHARYRHRLLHEPPRRGDRVRHAEVRARAGGADHHVQYAWRAQAAIKDVGRALEMPYRATWIASPRWFRDHLNIDARQRRSSRSPASRGCVRKIRRWTSARTSRCGWRGWRATAGVHAAGVVISPQPLTELVPLYTHQARRNRDAVRHERPSKRWACSRWTSSG